MKFVFAILLFLCLFSCIKRVPIVKETQLDIDYKHKKEILEKYNCDYFKKLESAGFDSVKNYYLKYLFTYMPLSDFADYDFEFYARQVDYAIITKTTYHWTEELPEEIFLHYVLPLRVGNENLDTSRIVFYKDLRNRLIPLNLWMEEAALEVNHWCHERVTYRSTDERTISPLGAVKSGFGRCGEESVFVVAALRAAGIPARQVYTPRWAHTDDNHAWVEVWIDGKWKFMGACEPAPVLNTGWFAAPATRAMLVHTKEFGRNNYVDDIVLNQTQNFSCKNTLKTYAPVKKIFAFVLDEFNRPVSGAEVHFQIYNYAEMYSLHSCKTNFSGLAVFQTGYGSVDVYVSKGGKSSMITVNPDQKGKIIVKLGRTNTYPPIENLYIPPDEGRITPVNDWELEDNAIRLEEENSIRKIRGEDFYDDSRAKDFIKVFGYPVEAKQFLINSRGNYEAIEGFLISCANKNLKTEALTLLSLISEKDLRDTEADILTEHLIYAFKLKDVSLDRNIFNNYVLCPRISNEILKPYRELILNSIDSLQLNTFRKEPQKIKNFIMSEIKTNHSFGFFSMSAKELNEYNVPISPAGVQKLKFCDDQSLMIYYVAFCRSLGIPARIDFASETVQYYHNDKWYDVVLSNNLKRGELKRSKLFLSYSGSGREVKYRIHFSIARLDNGFFKTVDLGWEVPLSDFEGGIDLPIGQYMLLTAIRNNDGSVLIKRKYFELKENVSLKLKLNLPVINYVEEVIGNFSHLKIKDKKNTKINSSKITAKNKYTAFCWIEPGKEPSNHIVKDIKSVKSELESNGITVIYMVKTKNFNPSDFAYPEDMEFYYDFDWQLLYSNLTPESIGQGLEFPWIIMVDANDNIISMSRGYVISAGENLINRVKARR
jgi:hypothetical protein